MRTLLLPAGVAAATVSAVILAACQTASVPVFMTTDDARASHVDPLFVTGNPTCADFAHLFPEGTEFCEIKIEPVSSGEYDVSCGDIEGTIDLTVNDTALGQTFDWESDGLSVVGVVAKGGPNANLYLYDPPETSDDGLHAPINPNNNRYYGLSHISFCAVEAPPTGAILIQKFAKNASVEGGIEAQAGVTFQVGDVGVTTDSDGLACIDDLPLGDHTIAEVQVAGYAAHPEQTVTLDETHAGSTCADLENAKVVEFVNTPLSNLIVKFESQVEGATKARIICYDEEGEELTSEEGAHLGLDEFSDAKRTYKDLLPNSEPFGEDHTAYWCKIVIDP